MKRIVIITMLMMSVLSLSAQLYVTPEVGMTAFKSKYADEWSSGWKIGAGVEYTFGPGWFSLKSGLYYTQRSHSFPFYYALDTRDEMFYTAEGNTNNHYLQIPLQLKLGRDIGKEKRIHIAFGPYVGIPLGNSGKLYYHSVNYGENEGVIYAPGYGSYGGGNYGALSEIQKTTTPKSYSDWGLMASVGMDIKQWTVGLAYDISLKGEDITKNYQTFTLSVGYKFKLTGK